MCKKTISILTLCFILFQLTAACFSTAGTAGVTGTADKAGAAGTIVAASSAGTAATPGMAVKQPVRKGAVIADHTSAKLEGIPTEWAQKAREGLHIAYGHTSHGSQITYGMMGLTYFRKEPFIFEKGAPKGSIDLRDNPFGGEKDLGNPDNKTWAEETRKYLAGNRDINVVMWSWCGQLSKADGAFVQNYLDLMQGLESDFPGVTFVYMTGHLDGTGENGNLARANNRIREFCRSRNKVLFDFADIESYDPDGNFYGDKLANDACWYDANGDGKHERNWAQDWQNSHKKGEEWYDCYSAHSEPINANRKAYAAWWLFARIAGWNGGSSGSPDASGLKISGGGQQDYEYYAGKLQSLGLFKGDGKGFDLERVPTRLEGAAMLTRLLGGEKEAQGKLYPHPFQDAKKSWGSSYVGYLHQYSLTKGVSESSFGCELKLEPASYVTFLLRVLGYSDSAPNSDFKWDNALEKALELGIVDEEYYAVLKQGDFDRGHMARLTWQTLNQKLKGGDGTLLEKLVQKNAIDKIALDKL